MVDSHEHYVVWHITFRSQGRSHLKVITGEGEETFPSNEIGIPQPGQTSRLTGHEPCPAAKCDVRSRESFQAKCKKMGRPLRDYFNSRTLVWRELAMYSQANRGLPVQVY